MTIAAKFCSVCKTLLNDNAANECPEHHVRVNDEDPYWDICPFRVEINDDDSLCFCSGERRGMCADDI